MDQTLEVVIVPVSDIAAAFTWAVQELKASGETPLIPMSHRSRFGDGVGS